MIVFEGHDSCQTWWVLKEPFWRCTCLYTGYCLDISWSIASNLSWPALSRDSAVLQTSRRKWYILTSVTRLIPTWVQAEVTGVDTLHKWMTWSLLSRGKLEFAKNEPPRQNLVFLQHLSRQRKTVLSFNRSMPSILTGELHLLQSFSFDRRPWLHKYSNGVDILAKNYVPQISVKTRGVTMPELAELQRIYTISKRNSGSRCRAVHWPFIF